MGGPFLDAAKLQAAFTLVDNGMPPAKAAEPLDIGRSTLYKALKIRS